MCPPLHTVSCETVSHSVVHSHVVPRTISRLTVTLSLKEHSPRIKNHHVIQIKTHKANINIHPCLVRNKNGNSPLINSYRDTNENTHKFTIQSIVYAYVQELLPSKTFVQLRYRKITAGDGPNGCCPPSFELSRPQAQLARLLRSLKIRSLRSHTPLRLDD